MWLHTPVKRDRYARARCGLPHRTTPAYDTLSLPAPVAPCANCPLGSQPWARDPRRAACRCFAEYDVTSDSADLLQQAAHARQLAAVLTDAGAIKVLLAMAAEFEALAQPTPDVATDSHEDARGAEHPKRLPFLRARRALEP